MGNLANLVLKWSETYTIQTPGVMNQYNQTTYTTSTCTGRLILTQEEKIVANGEKIIAKAKFFTTSLLTIDTKIGNYKIISVKACKDTSSNIEFYKYFLI